MGGKEAQEGLELRTGFTTACRQLRPCAPGFQATAVQSPSLGLLQGEAKGAGRAEEGWVGSAFSPAGQWIVCLSGQSGSRRASPSRKTKNRIGKEGREEGKMERNPSFYPSRPCGDEHWARTPKSPFLGHGTSLSRCFPHLASHQKVKWYRKIFCGCFWFPDSPPSTLLESVCMLLLLKPVKKKKNPKNHNKNCELEMLCKNKKLFVIFT